MISKTEVSDIQILNVDPSTCKRWKFADRIDSDFFRIDELCDNMKEAIKVLGVIKLKNK